MEIDAESNTRREAQGGILRMNREYPSRPIPAVGGLAVRDGKVLLVKRAKEPALGTWSIPGGAIRLGESLKDAVRRELKEETGLDVDPVEVVGVVERIFKVGEEVRFHYVIVDYACTVREGILRASSDAQDARWFHWEEILDLDLPEDSLGIIARALEKIERRPPQKRPFSQG